MGVNWKGWTVAEAAPSPQDWIDLSQPLEASGHAVAYFDQPQIRRIASMPDRPFNMTEITAYCHFGTHVDAPCHFIADGPSFEQIPLSRLTGRGTVVRVDAKADEAIGVDDILRAGARPRHGDILVIDTDWWTRYGTDAYGSHPYLSVEAAHWLVETGIKLVGLDTLGPDLPIPLRGADFSWPVHGVLLSNGVLIAENLTNLSGLHGQALEFVFGGLNIVGSDGGPARVMVRRIAE